ncbi:hypothetical protein [Paenibacillus methanolicus]|uniref:Uncharacterized protein n=1 Tax=Paenibacillus methanolicus TaxID=582686 RepID=A0A5S5CI20_9BACL|nr:hypothetical protein [Paenibacillus methanolicus]TYP78010.1 hypothetical protein BCM02_102586 [Paenibacillus methanolicus]
MRTLIELLLENIYIVIVVVGFLLSMVSKARKQGGGSRMPSFGGDSSSTRSESTGSGRSSEEERERMADWEEDSASRTYGAPSAELEAPIRDARQSVKAPPIRHMPAQSKPPSGRGNSPAKAQDRTSERRDGSFPLPQADDLKRAVVMAEILGPPRSKKPLRRP